MKIWMLLFLLACSQTYAMYREITYLQKTDLETLYRLLEEELHFDTIKKYASKNNPQTTNLVKSEKKRFQNFKLNISEKIYKFYEQLNYNISVSHHKKIRKLQLNYNKPLNCDDYKKVYENLKKNFFSKVIQKIIIALSAGDNKLFPFHKKFNLNDHNFALDSKEYNDYLNTMKKYIN